MRALLVGLVAVACSGPDTAATDSDTDVVAESIIPEQYRGLWNEGPCGSNGRGFQAYRLVEDGRFAEDGSFTGTERWFWFFPYKPPCIDAWKLTGTSIGNGLAHGCGECEIVLDIVREPEDLACTWIEPHEWFDIVDDGLPTNQWSYTHKLLMDTLSPSGNPNQDNRVLILNRYYKEISSEWANPEDYSIGTLAPDTEVYGPPASLTWVGGECYGG
jgi:hypothetical protein